MSYVTPAYPVKKMTGRQVARQSRTASRRAAFAASILAGELVLTTLTKKQIAAALGVSIRSVDKARRLTSEHRALMRHGHLELSSFTTPPTEIELYRTVKAAGIDRVWSVMEPMI
jgi:hypothetical protein